MKTTKVTLLLILMLSGTLVFGQHKLPGLLLFGQHQLPGSPKSGKLMKTNVIGSNPQHVEESIWNSAWTPFATEDIKYDIDGRVMEVERIEGDVKTRMLYSYNGKDFPTETILQLWEDGSWVNVERSREIFEGDTYLGWSEESWQDGEWVLDSAMRFSYTLVGNVVAGMIIESKYPGEDWTNMQRYTYEYEGGQDQPSITIIELWNNGVWEFNSKYEHIYIDENNWEDKSFSYSGGTWLVSSRMVYHDDEYGSLTMTMYSPVGNDWMAMSRTSYLNDVHGNEILFTIEFYSGDWEVFMGTQYLLTYEGNNLIERITQELGAEPGSLNKTGSSTWTNVFKEVFSLFHVAGTNEILNQDVDITFFPNPVNDHLNVRIVNPGGSTRASLQIFSLTGQSVLQQELVVNPGILHMGVPVSNISKGTYIIHVQGDNGSFLLNKTIQIN